MFPPIASRDSIVPDAVSADDVNPFTRAYEDVVYDDRDADDPLYEGPIVVHANGWLELEGNRLLSPHAVHHIDVYDDRDEWTGDAASGERDDGDGGGGDGTPNADSRTNRFSPR